MKELKVINIETFDSIKHIDENGCEYWYARELQKVLDYKEWRKFKGVIEKAINACDNSNNDVSHHFVGADKIYLIAQNGDSRKKVVALAQTYFAVQTRKQELLEKEYNNLTEDEKRFYQRSLTKKGNYSLNQTAKRAGVKNFDKFHNYGYKGLYNGETADDIFKRKKLRYREDILDNMGSEELADNLFRIVQTEAKLKNDDIKGEGNANNTHYNMGRDIRNFIRKQGGTMPEDLKTPDKSLKEIEKENRLYIDNIVK